MHLTPFRDDASAPAHDTCKTSIRQVDILQTDAAVDGEIVHSLLTLFDKGVAEHFPCQVFCLAVHFLESLIHRHRTYRHRTVAQYPLSGLMNIIARRKIHQRVATPLATPHGFLHLFLDSGSCGRVAYIGIDLNQEVGSYNHRFRLRVFLVGRNNGSSLGNLLAHELWSDVSLDAQLLAVHILADSHVFHLLCDDTFLGEIHLSLTLLAVLYP